MISPDFDNKDLSLKQYEDYESKAQNQQEQAEEYVTDNYPDLYIICNDGTKLGGDNLADIVVSNDESLTRKLIPVLDQIVKDYDHEVRDYEDNQTIYLKDGQDYLHKLMNNKVPSNEYDTLYNMMIEDEVDLDSIKGIRKAYDLTDDDDVEDLAALLLEHGKLAF